MCGGWPLIVGRVVGECEAASASVGNTDAILPSWADGASDTFNSGYRADVDQSNQLSRMLPFKRPVVTASDDGRFWDSASAPLMAARGWIVECPLPQWFNRLGLTWDDDCNGSS